VDKRQARTIKLVARSDGKLGVNFDKNIANKFTKDIAGGTSVFARISLRRGTTIQSGISLEQADTIIDRVYSDCQ